MRPVLHKNRLNNKVWILYALIFIICTVGIGVALYYTGFKDEKIGVVVGITDKESEEQDKYNDLKADFNTIFENNIDNTQAGNISVNKIREELDIVITAYNKEKNEENSTINVSIPFININDNVARQFNQRVIDTYKKRTETLMNQTSSMNIIYTIGYKAYIQNNILSLVIRAEYKEGNKNQKVTIETFNYNLVENREVNIDEILDLKKLKRSEATNKIREEIRTIQEQNKPLIESGYKFYERDYSSEKYDISNCNQFVYGKNGMLYIIFAYGNEENTSEMDIVIFN